MYCENSKKEAYCFMGFIFIVGFYLFLLYDISISHNKCLEEKNILIDKCVIVPELDPTTIKNIRKENYNSSHKKIEKSYIDNNH